MAIRKGARRRLSQGGSSVTAGFNHFCPRSGCLDKSVLLSMARLASSRVSKLTVEAPLSAAASSPVPATLLVAALYHQPPNKPRFPPSCLTGFLAKAHGY